MSDIYPKRLRMSGEVPLSYVRTTDSTYLVQVPDPNGRWGFFLADDDGTTWDGGFGIDNWELVRAKDVPRSERRRLGPLVVYHAQP